MAFVIKFIKGVRNHWKKSTFLAIALAYGTNYTNEYYQTQKLMLEYCKQAKTYGEQTIPVAQDLRNITVILNPNANRRKATKLFESYCSPILHLAGICITLIQTQSEGHAKTLVEELKQTDAIIIAGGDGTLSEVVTGLMRRPDNNDMLNTCPIGILPLGRSNTFASALFPAGETLKTVTALADAAMAVVKENTKMVDVMKIEVIADDESSNKPVYAVGELEWGAYRDAHAKRDKYWYFGSLRNYVTYIFNGYKSGLSWDCVADIKYSPPCEGCQNCYVKTEAPTTNKRWWSSFTLSQQKPNVLASEKDYSNILNESCAQLHQKQITTSDFVLKTSTLDNNRTSQLNLTLGPSSLSYFDFVSQGWQFEKGESRKIEENIKLKQIEILPKVDENKELWFSIDQEDYEVKPVKITLLPKKLKVFC
ncbi:Multi-substrate lipid kinase [Carabus blaptoides fortunei]